MLINQSILYMATINVVTGTLLMTKQICFFMRMLRFTKSKIKKVVIQIQEYGVRTVPPDSRILD